MSWPSVTIIVRLKGSAQILWFFPPPKASLMPPLLWRHGSKLSYLSYGKHLILNCIIVTFVNNSLLQKMNHVLLVLFFGGGVVRAHHFYIGNNK